METGSCLISLPAYHSWLTRLFPPDYAPTDRFGVARPTYSCPDAGDKGVVVDPYEELGELGVHPIIRSGETTAARGLKRVDARWARILFQQQDGVIDLQEYDRMVDTLCARGINVLGVINQETLVRQDYNVVGTATGYRREFAEEVGLLAGHFAGRINYWEVWNEQDLNPDGPPYIDPELYAPLLVETSQAIKQAGGQVLYGGMSSAWNRSHSHFVSVYSKLRQMGATGPNSPFDLLAIHPYPDNLVQPPESKSVNPSIYLRAVGSLPHTTILDKFMETMADPRHNNGNKRVWITEIGWNSAKGSPNLSCWAPLAITRQEQAAYLKASFDILFDEVRLWNRSTKAIEKIFWYQYRDVGLDDAIVCKQEAGESKPLWTRRAPLGYIPRLVGVFAKAIIDWHFGLYEGDKVTPKPSACAFAAYPAANTNGCLLEEVEAFTFLPLILK